MKIFIPARTESKRIAMKNFIEFEGRHMIEWALKKATHMAQEFDAEIVVSTTEIGAIMLDTSEYEFERFIRSNYTAGDDCGIRNVVEEWIDAENIHHDETIVCLLPCTPLLPPFKLLMAIEEYESTWKEGHMMMASICEFSTPIERRLSPDDEGLLHMCEPNEKRTQDCRTHYYDAGQFYVATAKRWLMPKPIIDGCIGYPLPRYEACDIDTYEDLMFAKHLYKGRVY